MAKRTPKQRHAENADRQYFRVPVIIFAGFRSSPTCQRQPHDHGPSDAAELVENRVKRADRLQQEVNELSACRWAP